jgi:hypothetical protein
MTTTLPGTAMRRWTRAEYDRLIELAVFQPGERLELLDRWLVVREGRGSGYSAGTRRVLHGLRRTLGKAWQALDDREYKASLHARAGVPEYWSLELVHEAVETHRHPAAGADARYGWRYGDVAVLRPPATVAALLAPERSTAVADLLP